MTGTLYILLVAAAVALSALGLYQRWWNGLRLAVALFWLGPLPGYAYDILGSSRHWTVPSPRGVLALPWALLPYLAFAVPMFGPYCFVAGLFGAALISRYTCPPAPAWVRPVAVVLLPLLAAVPVYLLERGDALAGASLFAGAFWSAVIWRLRRKIFG